MAITKNSPSILLLSAFSAFSLMTGCQPQAPRSDWPRQFANTPGGEAITFRAEGEPTDEAVALSGKLTFAVATREALRSSPDIQIALAKVRAAEADADQSRLLPNPVMTVVIRFRHESPVLTPSIAEDLLAILKRPAAMSAADKRLRAATAAAVTVVLATAAEVQNTFLSVLAIEDELAIFTERKKLFDRLAEVAQSRLKAGEGTRLDVLTIDAQRLQLAVAIGDKQLERSQNRLTLARLLGRPSGTTEWSLQPWSPPTNTLEAESIYLRIALVSRPEIQARIWELSALGDEASIAQWGVFDGILVGAEAERDLAWSGGPAIAAPLPLFDLGGARRDKAVATVIGARHELVQTSREVIESVRKAYTTYLQTQRQLAQVRDQLTPVQEKRRAQAEASYKAGETDLTTLLVAEQDLQETREKLIELSEKVGVAFVALQRATGGETPSRHQAPTSVPVP